MKLTSKARKALPKSDFALPGGRYPVNDKAHVIQEIEEKINNNSVIFNLSPEEKIELRKLVFSFLGRS